MLGRRAVIWLKQKTFSIIFQNQSQVAAKDFGWIIPLPGVPTKVEQSEDGFVDRLDESTAPMIEKTRCFFPCYWVLQMRALLSATSRRPASPSGAVASSAT
jgi:hypothetical protein